LLFYFRYHPISAWSAVTAIVGLALYFTDLLIRNEWAVALAVVSGVISVVGFFRRRYQINQIMIFDHPLYPPTTILREIAKQTGLEIIEQGNQPQRIALIDPQISRVLSHVPVAISVSREHYKLPPPISDYAYDFLTKRGTRWDSINENKVRITSAFGAEALEKSRKWSCLVRTITVTILQIV
jgi:hypothetical protein